MNSLAKKLAVYGVTSALVCLCTMFLRIPVISVNGYINFGDALIFIAAAVFGPLTAAISGGIGSALADLIGYPLYAPFTLVIKGVEGLIAGILVRKVFRSKGNALLQTVLSAVSFLIAACFMILGYFFAASILASTFAAGVAELLAGLVQGGASIAIALIALHATPLASVSAKHVFITDPLLHRKKQTNKKGQ